MPAQLDAIVNLHDEGPTALPSLISAWRAVNSAQAHGIDAGLVVVLDRADDATAALARSWTNRGARIVESDHGDLGAARNVAVEQSTAEWVAFLDADDLWGEQWLVQAYAAASSNPPRSTIDVWHPAVNVIFGDHHSLLHHVASTDQRFSWSRFRVHNAWTALAFVRRSHIEALPYPRNELAGGFGFEDWSWNMEVLRRGGRHNVVADSCHFIRRTNGASLLQQSRAALRTPYPFDDMVARLDESNLPGAPTAGSERSRVDADLPPTHERAQVDLSPAILDQVRTAISIEPAIADTLSASGTPRRLPQNFNTHVGAQQQVVERIVLAQRTGSFTSASALMESVPELLDLPDAERTQVIADVLLDPGTQNLPRGTGPLIDEAMSAYPQLRSATW